MTWPQVRLGDVCRVIPGYAFKSQDWTDEGIRVIKIKNIREDNTVDLSDCDHVPSSLLTPRLDKFVLKDGDILVAMTGATAGKVGRVRAAEPVLLNQRVAKIAPDPTKSDPLFIWSVVSSKRYQDLFFRLADGAAQPNMSGGQIEGVQIPCPPMATQSRIAAILSVYDALIENNTQRIATLEEMSRRIYEEWFVHFRFPGHENVGVVESELGPVPDGWPVQSFGSLATFQKGRKPAEVYRQPAEGLIPMLLIDALRGGQMEYARPKNLLEVLDSDTIMVMDGSGSCEVFTGHVGAIGSTLGRYRAIDGGFGPFLVYLLFVTRRDDIRGKNIGAAIPHANKDYINSIRIAKPPAEIALRFEQVVAPMFGLRKVLRLKNANLRNARDLLLPKLISGELDVSTMLDPRAVAA